MKSMKTILAFVQAIPPGLKAAGADGATVSVAGYEALTFLVNVGTVTDGTTTFKIQESNDGTNWFDAPAANQLGTFPTLTSGAGNGSNKSVAIDYIGPCAYARVVLAIAAPTTGALVDVIAILGAARHNPAGATQLP